MRKRRVPSQPSKLMKMGYRIWRRVRDRIARDADWTCRYCGIGVFAIAPDKLLLATIEHKLPLSRGGTWKRRNLACACYGCNNLKGSMTEDEFWQSLGVTDRGEDDGAL